MIIPHENEHWFDAMLSCLGRVWAGRPPKEELSLALFIMLCAIVVVVVVLTLTRIIRSRDRLQSLWS